jgi:hypothetical protein
MSKFTPWFPADVKPAYPGVYQAKKPRFVVYRRWDGERWYYGSTTVYKAACETTPYPFKDNPWRGLAEPPKGWAK